MSASSPLRIGFYGGLANNMYVFAKAFAEAGVETVFFRDRTDLYPFSQPVWEDCPFTLPIEERPTSWADWDALEKAHHWTAPSWLWDPQGRPVEAAPATRWKHWTDLLRPKLYRNAHWPTITSEMARCDILIVCGIEGVHLAYASGRPYMIWPHGGDIRLAAGYPALPKGEWKRNWRTVADRLCYSNAFRQATMIIGHDPTGVGGPFHDVSNAMAGKTMHLVGIPIPLRPRPSPEDRVLRRRALFSRLGIGLSPDVITAFIPSRIDFHWKGHDRLLKAALNIPGIQYVFAGWGGDRQEALALAQSSGLDQKMHFLPFALSKPLLFETFDSVDFVIDQFTFGTYGTAAAEALAGGCPVMMHIDDAAFHHRGWQPPPVLNSASESSIHALLAAISSGTLDLEEWSHRAQMWSAQVHSPETVIRSVQELSAVALKRNIQ